MQMPLDIAAWYEKYGPMVIRRCRSILKDEEDALDAVHDVFVSLLKGEDRLHGRFPSSLLYTMATNACLNRLKSRKWERPEDFSGNAEILLAGMDREFDKVEAGILLEDILRDESEANRAIYFMYHVDEMTLKEIGEAVDLSISGVKKRLEAFRSRARTKLLNQYSGS